MRIWQPAVWVAAAIGLPASCGAWQIAAGGGLLAGFVPGSAPGWQFAGQWSREAHVGQRWLVDLTASQFATRETPGGLLERAREASALVLWERRAPFGYVFRPWWGVGAGISHYRFDERVRLNGAGYAVDSYPAVSGTDWDLAVGVTVPLSWSWSVGITAQTGFPSRISTVSMIVLWRLL